MSELKELLAGFNHEKTNLEAVSKYLCDRNLSTSLSVVKKTIGSRETVKVSSPCSETSVFGRDLKLFYKHLEECPSILEETKTIHTKVSDMKSKLNDLRTNYTRARVESFEAAHEVELDQDDMRKHYGTDACRQQRYFDRLAKAIAKHLHKHYGVDADTGRIQLQTHLRLLQQLFFK